MNRPDRKERPTNIGAWIAGMLIFYGLNAVASALVHSSQVPIVATIRLLVGRVSPQAILPAPAEISWQLVSFNLAVAVLLLASGVAIGNRLRRQRQAETEATSANSIRY